MKTFNFLLLFTMVVQPVLAVKIKIISVSPRQAYEMQQQGVILLDVRTRPEYELVGHPLKSVNIPYKIYPTWQVDPDFVKKVRAEFSGEKLLIICRSGKRSLAATELLRREGLDVINVLEGFEGPKDADGHRDSNKGWRNRKLPWEY